MCMMRTFKPLTSLAAQQMPVSNPQSFLSHQPVWQLAEPCHAAMPLAPLSPAGCRPQQHPNIHLLPSLAETPLCVFPQRHSRPLRLPDSIPTSFYCLVSFILLGSSVTQVPQNKRMQCLSHLVHGDLACRAEAARRWGQRSCFHAMRLTHRWSKQTTGSSGSQQHSGSTHRCTHRCMQRQLTSHASALVGLAVVAVRAGGVEGHGEGLAGGVEVVLVADGLGVHARLQRGWGGTRRQRGAFPHWTGRPVWPAYVQHSLLPQDGAR